MLKRFLLSVLALLLTATFSFADEKQINGAGASFPYPVYGAWSHSYNKATGVQLNYQSIGSGGGIKQIQAKTVDFGASDNPLKPEELEKNGLLQFPAIMGGVVPIVNIKGVSNGQLSLTPKVLADIFLAKITKWNDPAIKSINKDVNLPDAKIEIVHRADGSGTTAIFTSYLSIVSPEWEKAVGKGTSVKWPAGIGGKGNEGVANYVKKIDNSIGYVEFAYAEQNKLTYTKLQNKEGNFVEPSFDNFKEAAAYAKWDKSKGYYLWLVDSPGKKSWPIAGASFILLRKDNPEANKKVVKFFDWSFKNGDEAAIKLIYIPLPENLKESIRGYWKDNGAY